jgi:two-component system NtrC family sensor kinase
MDTPHILLVDDEVDIRHLCSILLQKEGYQVTTADCGAKALSLLDQQPFDLVVSDLMMPDMSGLEVLAQVKTLVPTPEFILITAYGSLESAVEALRKGAADYVIKPFENVEFNHSVARVLAYQQVSREKQELIESLQTHNQKLTQMLEASNRLAYVSPLPELVIHEIIDIAARQLALNVAVSVMDKDDNHTTTSATGSLVKPWLTVLEQTRPGLNRLHRILGSGRRISQTFILASGQLTAALGAAEGSPAEGTDQLVAIPLTTQGGRTIGVLWIADITEPPQLEDIQRLEIFANQIAGTLDSVALFSRQLSQLRVRNTLVYAGQRIATLLNHREVAATVVNATLKTLPEVEVAAVYYRPNIEAELESVALTRAGSEPTRSPVELSLIAKVLIEKQTHYDAYWLLEGEQKSLVIEPLLMTAVPLGALAVVGSRSEQFTEDDHQLLTMLANQAAVALQNASLYAEAQRVDEIEALYEAGKAIDRTLNLQETLTTSMAISRSLTGATVSNVYLYSSDGERIDSVVTLGDDTTLTDADRRKSAMLARTAQTSQQPGLVEKPANEYKGICNSWLAVPLSGGERSLGVLILGAEPVAAFSENDVRLMQIISNHAALAIEKARLYEELQRRLQQTEALNTISQSITTTLELERVLDLVVHSAVKTIPVATHSSVHLLNNARELEITAQVAQSTLPLPVEISAMLEQATQRVVARHAIVRRSRQPAGDRVWSVLAAPLWTGHTVSGAIAVMSPRPEAFQAGDETLLKSFASHASIAIQNANLFRDLSSAYKDLSSKQDEILRSHSTLQALFNGITDGLYITSPDPDRMLRIVAVNQAEARRLNTSPGALIDQLCDRQLWGEATAAVTRLVNDTFATGQEGIWDSQVDAGRRDIFNDRDVYTYPIFDANGNVAQVIIFAHDVSEQRRLQASLFRSANMAAVGQLASSVAHQINNPLTVIIANAQIMEMDGDPNAPDYSLIKHIEEAGVHIRTIVQNLLDFSTQESYEWFDTDLLETIDDAMTLVSHSLRKSEIQVVNRLESLPLITASASHLKLLWMNLLLNARDAIMARPSHEDPGQVILSCETPDNETVQIRLTDNGVGLPLDQRERLFHPFFTTKSSGRNLGLGLFTCRAIVENHHGQIELENITNGPGVVVTVTFPVDMDI